MYEALETNSPEYQRVHHAVRATYGLATEYYCYGKDHSADKWTWQHGLNPRLTTSYEPRCNSCHTLYDMNSEWHSNLSLSQIGNKSSQGERHHSARLTAKDVIKIRAMHATGGWKYKDLARIFDMSYNQICDIINRKKWKHV